MRDTYLAPLLISLFGVFLLAANGHAAILHGRVERVIDGDTIRVVTENDDVRVRIRAIDAPESDQEFGGEARIALDKLLSGQNVILNTDGYDNYGRLLASVAVSGTDVGLYMIERGYAWYYRAYGTLIPTEWQSAYRVAEADARATHSGLWQSQGAVPPWSWRKQKREAAQAKEDQHKETLEGVTQELKDNSELFSEKLADLRNMFLSDDENRKDEDKAIPQKERLSWWEIFAKLGEGASRWLKAFFQFNILILNRF